MASDPRAGAGAEEEEEEEDADSSSKRLRTTGRGSPRTAARRTVEKAPLASGGPRMRSAPRICRP